MSDLDVSDPTPTQANPCTECGTELVLVADDTPAPTTPGQAYRRSVVCISTRDRKWSWCPRTGWLKVCFG